MINNFNHKFCINLDRRKDKWEQCQDEFIKHDIQNVIRISGVDGNPENLPNKMIREPIITNIGCTLSHLNILKYAQEKNLENIVVFEDDCVFVDDFNQKFNYYFPQIPNNWDMIYFSGTHIGGMDSVKENVWRTLGTWTAHSYIMNRSVYQRYIDLLSQLTDVVDVIYQIQHPLIKAYILLPHITYQREGISDIQNTYTNYKELKNLCK